jgi:hypothetical protein
LSDVGAKLRAIVERMRRNVPHRRDPERFHVEKSCLAQDLERIADELELDAVNHNVSVTRTRPRELSITTELIGGRRIIVQRPRKLFAIFGREPIEG